MRRGSPRTAGTWSGLGRQANLRESSRVESSRVESSRVESVRSVRCHGAAEVARAATKVMPTTRSTMLEGAGTEIRGVAMIPWGLGLPGVVPVWEATICSGNVPSTRGILIGGGEINDIASPRSKGMSM